MHIIAVAIIVFLICWFFPKFGRYAVVAPITGIAFGCGLWVMAIIVLPSLMTLKGFGACIVVGMMCGFAALHFMRFGEGDDIRD
jgi:hypothetical protein